MKLPDSVNCSFLATLLACFGYVLNSASAQDIAAPKRYALLVGVTKYEAAFLNTPPLQFPEKDATDFAGHLKAGGYEVEVLLGPSANKAAIERKLLNLAQKGNDEGAVIIGFFGHGVEYDGTDEAMFCPYDTSLRVIKDADGKVQYDSQANSDRELMEPDPASLVGMSAILRGLRLCKAGNKLLLADCCRSSPNSARGRAFGSSVSLSDLPDRTAALFACSKGEEAQEHADWEHGAAVASVYAAEVMEPVSVALRAKGEVAEVNLSEAYLKNAGTVAMQRAAKAAVRLSSMIKIEYDQRISGCRTSTMRHSARF